MMRQVGEHAGRTCLALERLAHGQVHLRPPQPAEPVEKRAAHELVGEPVCQRPGRKLLEHSAADSLVEGGQQLRLREAGGPAHDAELELRSGRGRKLEQVDGPGGQAGEPLGDDLTNALGSAELSQRPGEPDCAIGDLDDAGLDERAPQLADEERVAVGQVADRPCELLRAGADVTPCGAADELRYVVARKAGEPQPHDVVGPAQVGERLGECSRQVGVCVTEGADQ